MEISLLFFEAIIPFLHCILLFTIPNSPAEEQTNTDSIFYKGYLKQFFLLVFFSFSRSFTGYSALMSWIENVVGDIEGNLLSQFMVSVLVHTAQVVGACCSSFLIGNFGMRKSWIISGIGQVIFLLPLFADSFGDFHEIVPIITIFFCIFFYSLAFGPIPFMITAELFPDYVRSTFQGICVAFIWLFSALVTFIFPYFKSTNYSWAFLIFTVCCLASIF